jgi:beta-1,4-mannosyl-glycoprotein beta-1,4-N-acetylglucosaminyltransferase
MNPVKVRLKNIIKIKICINMSKIYDCFNFFNELDILEIRLNILYDYVDYFVIVESSVTHTGVEKEFIFDKNKERFSKFLDKIILYKVSDTPNDFVNLIYSEDETINKINDYIVLQTNRFNRWAQHDYGRDFFQKECVRRPLINCEDDDIILVSDADEIPNPEILLNLKELDLDNNRYSLNQTMYFYYLNIFKESTWYGTKISKYKNIKNISFNELRGDESLTIKITNGGWHFSFMGGKEMVKTKMMSYSAKDMANDHVLSSISENMENNIDPFFRGGLTKVEIDFTYPKYILNNLENYSHLIKE